MYETILAALDPHDDRRAVLDHATTLAEGVGASLYVITVVEPTGNRMAFGIEHVDDLNQATRALAEKLDARDTDVTTAGEVRRGDPADVLLQYADEIAADLLVVGQSRAEGLEAAIFGRTTDELAQRTTRPLAIVPLHAEN